MFFFDQKVVNLKAWELYLGNALWTFFIGLVLVLTIKVLDVFGLEKTGLGELAQKAGQVMGARSGVANDVLETDMEPMDEY